MTMRPNFQPPGLPARPAAVAPVQPQQVVTAPPPTPPTPVVTREEVLERFRAIVAAAREQAEASRADIGRWKPFNWGHEAALFSAAIDLIESGGRS